MVCVRRVLAVMSLADVVHASGWGFWFQCDVQVSIVPVRSAALVWVRPLGALRADTENQPLMRLAQLALMGVKCRCRRARLG